MNITNKEIEAKFLEIDEVELKLKLKNLGAIDLDEDLLKEVIIYDKDLRWLSEAGAFIRIRKCRGKIYLAYKNHFSKEFGETEEIEFEIGDFDKALIFFEKIGFLPYRHQEKKRHTFILNDVTIDIDTWPKIPTYVEIEGKSKEEVKKTALSLGFDWSKANFEDARTVIEKIYSVPVGKMKWFTFSRVE